MTRSHPSRSPQGTTTIRILFVSDSIREPVTGIGRVAMTWLRELVNLGVEVIAIDSEENPTAHSICGDVRVLPCNGSFMRMGRWHLTLLRRIQGLGIG